MKPVRQVIILLALAVIFSAPLVLAWGVYHDARWHPRAGLQYGELLLPLQPVTATLDPSIFRGHWTLLYHSGERCDTDCTRLLATLQHIRLAQGQAMSQVQRVLVLTKPPAGQPGIDGDDLRIVTADHWPLPSSWVYLLDPQGNMVLRYRPGFEPRGLLKDLQRLLKQSGAG